MGSLAVFCTNAINIYAGINGYLDGIPVENVRAFLVELRQYLASSKPKYGQILRDTQVFSDEAESILKEALVELTGSSK